MKKQIILIMIILLACIGCIALSACVDEAPPVVKKYSLTFDVNGGNEHNTTITIDENSDFYVPENPTRDTYTFAGWHTANGTDDENWGDEFNSFYNITKDLTIYAKWEIIEITYTVDFVTNCDTIIDTQVIGNLGLLNTVDPLSKIGYNFIGWYSDIDLTIEFNTTTDVVTKNLTLYAGWSNIKVAVEFNSMGGSQVASHVILYNELAIEPAIPNNDGYFFHGWYSDINFTQPFLFKTNKLTEDTTLYAKWNIFEVSLDLEFASHDDGDYYSIEGIGTETKTQFALPDVYKGKLVKHIGYDFITSDSTVRNLYLPYAFNRFDQNYFPQYHNKIITIYTENAEKDIRFSNHFLYQIYYNVTPTDILEQNGTIYLKANELAIATYQIDDTEIKIAEYVIFNDEQYYVEIIGNFFLYGNQNISEITLPSSINTIGENAFSFSSLSAINLNEGLLKISKHSLEKTNLSSITIPSTVTHIDDNVLADTISLNTLIFGNSSQLVEIGIYAFSGISITSVNLPSSLEILNRMAFISCKQLRTLTFESSSNLNVIDAQAFSYCDLLENFILPDSVTTINSSAFSHSNITALTIPANVSLIAPQSFSSCFNLKTITVDPANLHYKSLDGNLYNHDLTTIVLYAIGQVGRTFAIPDSVEIIGSYAFASSFLDELLLPNSVTIIGDRAFTSMQFLSTINIPNSVKIIERHAFAMCWRIENIHIPASVEEIGEGAFFYITLQTITVDAANQHFHTVDGVLYSKDMTRLLHYPATGKSDTIYIIPDSVTQIDSGAFTSLQYSKLDTIVIPTGVVRFEGVFVNTRKDELQVFLKSNEDDIEFLADLHNIEHYVNGEWEMLDDVPTVI